ncbi:MAG: transketolase C-terminal domain-containing protein [Oscillospiraceae bacterium]|nr:transketolase C-terminal domain-containing protein [Oscillospiraceae bacterium]
MSEAIATRIAYGETLAELGRENEKIVVLDADVSTATMTLTFKKEFPDRFFDCGIAECDMAGISAGLSTMGFIPFFSSFAIFGTGRCYEIIRNAIGYPHFNVKIACTHAGITVGEDGSSHQSFEDIALMRGIPGMTVLVPGDATETRKAIRAAAAIDGPVYIRMSRAPAPVLPDAPFEVGKANVLREGRDGVIFTCGFMLHIALETAAALAQKGLDISVVNIHTIKPIDSETILKYARSCKKVLTLEEHSVIGGLGTAVSEVLIGNGDFKFKKLGIEDRFGESGSWKDLLDIFELSTDAVTKKAEVFFK